jgi:hypothetical protein
MVPESPRWQMTKNKFKQAFSTFDRIAKSNKKQFDLSHIHLETLDDNTNESFSSLTSVKDEEDEPKVLQNF